MGKLVLPLPELGISIDESADEMQARIRERVPEKLRASISVKALREGSKTGLEVSYDDRAENFVYSAIEYPRVSGRKETAEPKNNRVR